VEVGLTAWRGLGRVEVQFGGDDMITLTENATKHIKTLLSDQGVQGKPLRVYIETGGCSGMEYGMAFDDKKPDDEVIAQDGVEVVVDPMSMNFLKGSEIDYQDSLQGSGFRIKNPNAHSSCGCGRSFN
jgi:iron-sulfur cluster assembly protein/iron-sulfur cluster insertion protein